MLIIKKTGYNSTYKYFVVPLLNKKINLSVFLGNLYDKQNYRNNLLFNPFNKIFYFFYNWSEHDITSKIISIEKNIQSESDSFISHLDYFQQKYEIKLKNHLKGIKNLLFNGYIYSLRGKRTITNVLPSENMRITPCEKKIFENFNLLVKKFVYFEVFALAEEAKTNLGLSISTKLLSHCFISKNNISKL